jgi:nitrogen fixation protein NifB
MLCPELKVAGVAGPGDPLAGDEALDTLIMVRQRHPELINCMSTNGLELFSSMERILAAGIRTITVTVNAVNPKILAALNKGVIIKGQFYGEELGARLLIEAQENGVRLAHQNNLVIKINTVLVPSINDGHVGEVARQAKDWGADLLNIIPLIPGNELKHLPEPTLAEKEAAEKQASKYLPVKQNCRRCRADACGIPGVTDYSREIYGQLEIAETFSHG